MLERRVLQNPFIPDRPTRKQALFLILPILEAFYGGAAGGGKSNGLLMAALMYVDVPGYAAIVFRRTYSDLALPGALMDRAGGWLGGTAARWDEREKTWRFPSGATLTFGYMETASDMWRYQSAEFQSVAFDEVTQFTEAQYRFLFSRLRKPAGMPVPLRMRAASNPVGPGKEWVHRRFVVEGRQAGRVFMPAGLADNPHLDRDAYLSSLAELDPVTRLQLLEGDWEVRAPGRKFRREWFEVVDAAPVDAYRVRFWDLAATEPKPGQDPDWTVGARVARTPSGTWLIEDIQRARTTPQGVDQLIRQTAMIDGPGVEIFIEQEPGASGKTTIDHYVREVLVGFAARGHRSTGPKEVRANPVSAQAEAGNVKLVRGPWISAFLDEAEAFPGGGHDDQVDAVSGAFAVLSTRAGVVTYGPNVWE